MEDAIKRRENRSSPGEDRLTNPLFKASPKEFAELLVEVMKSIIEAGRCPEIWKRSKTILL
jgi:hypothetical protein